MKKALIKRVASLSQAQGYIRYIIEDLNLTQGKEKYISVPKLLAALIGTDVSEAINLFSHPTDYLVELYPFLGESLNHPELNKKLLAQVLNHKDFVSKDNLDLEGCELFIEGFLEKKNNTRLFWQNALSCCVHSELLSDTSNLLKNSVYSNGKSYMKDHITNVRPTILTEVEGYDTSCQYTLEISNTRKVVITLDVDAYFEDYEEEYDAAIADAAVAAREEEPDYEAYNFLNPYLLGLLCHVENNSCEERCLKSIRNKDYELGSKERKELGTLYNHLKERIMVNNKEDWMLINSDGCEEFISYLETFFQRQHVPANIVPTIWLNFLNSSIGEAWLDYLIDFNENVNTESVLGSRAAHTPKVTVEFDGF